MWYCGYSTPRKLLELELIQLASEGYIVSDEIKQEAATFSDETDDSLFRAFYQKLKNLPRNPGFTFDEPCSLEEIRAARPAKRAGKTPLPYSRDILLDKYLGAWLGRCCGCALGRPIEAMGADFGHKAIRDYLKLRGDWPLRDYISGIDVGDHAKIYCPASWRENIQFMETDDDIRYTLIGLELFEKYGADFTSYDIAFHWHYHVPLVFFATAEQHALLNFGMFMRARGRDAFNPDFTSTFNNPYREWIGAQIRADFFGFMAPGDPEKAAEYAWRDGCWTHRKNGIYGEMFIAAAEAEAFVTNDPIRIIEAGLGEIPENCRLAYELREALKAIPNFRNADEFMDGYMDKRFEGMSAVHTINNAVLCAASLVYGGLNPDRTIFEAVTGGLDTDCDGATCGAIAGIVTGGSAFGGTLAPRLNNLIKSSLATFGDVTITDIAQRTLAAYEKNA